MRAASACLAAWGGLRLLDRTLRPPNAMADAVIKRVPLLGCSHLRVFTYTPTDAFQESIA
jgi:hypothetical protein